MKVIYADYWGSYISVVAASIHLGILEEYDEEKIRSIKGFGENNFSKLGELIFFAEDQKSRRIYILGVKKSGRIAERALNGISKIFGLGKNDVDFVDLYIYENVFTKMGGFLSQKLCFKSAGEKLVLIGIKRNFNKLKNLVHKMKEKPLK